MTDEKIKQVIVEAAGRMNLYAFSDVVYIAREIESAVREECAAPVAEVSASGHDLNYADYAHALDVIYAFAPPEPLDKLPGGNAYREGWIDGTQAYQLTIEKQGEQK